MSDTFTGADFEAPASGDTSAASGTEPVTSTVDTTAPPEAGTTVPAATSASPSTDVVPSKPQGPIPFEAHTTALKNAREKARAEYEAEWNQQYGWAKDVDRHAVARAAEMAQRYQQDRGGFLRDLMREAIEDPQLAPMVRSEMARALGQRTPQAPQPVDLTPRSVQMEDGSTMQLFTVEQMQAAMEQRDAKLRAEFAPAVQTATQLQAARETAEAIRQADSFAAEAFTEMKDYPQFKEHGKEIAAKLATMTLKSDHPAEVKAAVLTAYASIVLPKLSTLERRAVLTDQHATAAASTVNPSRTGTAPPKSWAEMSTSEALAYAASQTTA